MKLEKQPKWIEWQKYLKIPKYDLNTHENPGDKDSTKNFAHINYITKASLNNTQLEELKEIYKLDYLVYEEALNLINYCNKIFHP